MELVESCPITGISTEKTKPVSTIYNAEYVQTPDTGHVYLRKDLLKMQLTIFI